MNYETMPEVYFPQFLEASLNRFLDSHPRSADDSFCLEVRASLNDILSDGLHTKGHYFYLFSNEVNEPVADVWLGLKDNGTVWGWDFYVYPEYQGQGYGYQVLSATLELLISLGFEELRFTVFKSNTNAIGLYKKFGFKVLAEHDEQLEMSIKVS